MNGAPHPNAARVFVNWLLTREGQTAYSRASGLQSARVDVPTDHLEANLLRDPAIKYFFADHEDFIRREREYIEKAKEVFGPLLK